MYKITSNTLFTGNHLIELPECRSTNDILSELTRQSLIPEGAIVITDNQTAGRGQRGNVWEARSGDNLTFSLLYKPTFIPVQFPFGLNIAVSLGIFDTLNEYMPQKVKIKWPNDMYVSVNGGDKKICGILIENTIKKNTLENSIIGIGVNVNQENFDESKATSLTIQLNKHIDKNEVLNKLCSNLEARYLALKLGKNMMDEYLSHLYLYNEKAIYSSEGETFEGIIRGVDEFGRLEVCHILEQKIEYYAFKEISLEGRL